MSGKPARLTRWKEHFSTFLRRPSAPGLKDVAEAPAAATSDMSIRIDSPNEVEVTKAVRRVKNENAAA